MEISTDDLQFMSKILDTVNAENKEVCVSMMPPLREQADAEDAKALSEVEDI